MDTNSFYGKVSHHRYLRHAVDEIEESSTTRADIVITGPPDGGDGSDTECADEDEMDPEKMPNEVAGEVDVFLEDEGTSHEENIEPEPKKKKVTLPNWKRVHTPDTTHLPSLSEKDISKILQNKHQDLINLDEYGLYVEIFSEVIDLLVLETNRYANRDKNDPSFSISENDFYKFFGLLILSGYNIRHAEKDYWSKSSQLRCDDFTQTMSRNKFQKIKGYLHAADNQNLDASKMAKVKPLYDLILSDN